MLLLGAFTPIDEFFEYSKSHPFAGRFEQLRIRSLILSTERIKIPETLTATDDTLALYRFDESSGKVLKDASGNGHDGTIHGAEWVSQTVPSADDR